MRNAIKATTNMIFAAANAVRATTPKPSAPAIRAMIRKAIAQLNIYSPHAALLAGPERFDVPIMFRQSRIGTGVVVRQKRSGKDGNYEPVQALTVVATNQRRTDMPKDAHSKAAEHHENAAKSHRTAAEHHGKGEHARGREESARAHGHSKTAHEHSEMAHGKSQSQK